MLREQSAGSSQYGGYVAPWVSHEHDTIYHAVAAQARDEDPLHSRYMWRGR
jgi:hypothetical protein